jgi:hypothetical protein
MALFSQKRYQRCLGFAQDLVGQPLFSLCSWRACPPFAPSGEGVRARAPAARVENFAILCRQAGLPWALFPREGLRDGATKTPRERLLGGRPRKASSSRRRPTEPVPTNPGRAVCHGSVCRNCAHSKGDASLGSRPHSSPAPLSAAMRSFRITRSCVTALWRLCFVEIRWNSCVSTRRFLLRLLSSIEDWAYGPGDNEVRDTVNSCCHPT